LVTRDFIVFINRWTRTVTVRIESHFFAFLLISFSSVIVIGV
jgi:hypothetical protein